MQRAALQIALHPHATLAALVQGVAAIVPVVRHAHAAAHAGGQHPPAGKQ